MTTQEIDELLIENSELEAEVWRLQDVVGNLTADCQTLARIALEMLLEMEAELGKEKAHTIVANAIETIVDEEREKTKRRTN